MALADAAPENTPVSRTTENDDIGDAFARSPSDAFNSASEHGRGLRSQELGSIRSSSRFAGSSSGIYFLRTVCDAIAKAGTSENLTSTPAVNLRFIPGEDERGSDSTGCIWHTAEVRGAADVEWPSFNDLVTLISNTYIRGWHCLLPFLQAETILQALENACLRKALDPRSPQSVCIRSVISISLLDKRQTSGADGTVTPLPACLVFRSLEDCNSSIYPLLGDNSLDSLQGMLSAQLFMVSIMELRSAARLGGWIVRMCFDLGLHRCPCRYRLSFGEAEISIRRRIFWTVYNLDRYLCQALGLPLGIRDEDVDVCLPNNEVHKLQEEKVTDANNDSRLMPLVLLSSYSGIKGRLMEISNKCMLHRTSDAEHALRNIHVDILKWRNEVQDFTAAIFGEEDDLDSPRNSSIQSGRLTVITPAHRLILQIKYHELLLLMHRPALSAKSTDESYPVAMLTCLSSARAIISLTKRYLSRYKIAEGRVEYPILWHVMLSTIWMSGLVVVFAAFEGGATFESANRDIQSVWLILEHLSLRLPGKPKACEVALRALFQLMCRKRGFSSAQPPSGTKLGKRKRPNAVSEQSQTNIANSHGTSSSTPGEGRVQANYTTPSTSNNMNAVGNPEFSQSSQSGPEFQADTTQPFAPSPSQGSLDENQVLWLLDVPNLLDDQSLNFFTGQAGSSLDLRAASEFNADALFNSLRMNMGNEESFYFNETGPPFI